MTIQAVRGTRDILPDEIAAWQRDRGRGARPLRPLRLPRDPDAGLRGDGALRPRHRGGDRHRLEGDVHLRRPRRRLADAAARGHRRHRARGDRAQPAQHRPRAQGLRASGRCSGASGRRRAATASSTRWTSRPSASRARRSTPRSIELALAYLDACGVRAARAASSTRWATATAGPAYVETLRAGAAGRGAARCARDCQRRAETNPLRVLDCKVPGGPGDDRHAAPDHRPPVRRVPRPLRRGAPAARAARHPVPPEPPAGARARLLRAHDLRGDERPRSGRRAASSAAAATTAS